MTGRRPWTEWEQEQLERLVKVPDQTHRTIAEVLNRTEAAIANRMCNTGLRFNPDYRPSAKAQFDSIMLNGEPLIFAETGNPCARCAVRENVHHEHGCGQFAAEVRVRLR